MNIGSFMPPIVTRFERMVISVVFPLLIFPADDTSALAPRFNIAEERTMEVVKVLDLTHGLGHH
jgi:hypothetical protein